MTEVGPKLQTIAVTQGNAETVHVTITPDNGLSLVGTTIVFSVFAQDFGTPFGPALIKKTTNNGIQVTSSSNPPTFDLDFTGAETASLLGNYMFEIAVKDASNDIMSTTQGMFHVGNMPTTDFTLGAIP